MADIKYVITADAKGAVTEIKKVEGAVKGMKTQATQAKAPLVGMFKQIALGAGAALLAKAAIRGLVRFMGDCITKAGEQEIVMAKLDAVLRSTGGAAGITKEEVIKLASGLQAVTTYGDETIISAQNLLLTFTKIGKDVFPDATEIVLDMSAALGQDLKSSAIQVGKALQDPILGATALRRVGVNLSQSQADLIKKMVETGDVMGAQTLILNELKSEFGGTAREIRETFIGSVEGLKNKWGDLQEQIGTLITENDSLNATLGMTENVLSNLVVLAPKYKDKLQIIIDAIPFFKGWKSTLVLINAELELEVARMEAAESQAEAFKWAAKKLVEGLDLLGLKLPFISAGTKDVGDESETASRKIPKLKAAITDTTDELKEFLKTVDVMDPDDLDAKAWITEWESMESPINDILALIGIELPDAYDDLSDDTKTTTDEINQYWDTLSTDLGRSWGTLFLDLTDKNSTFEESIANFFNNIRDSFRATIADMISDWVTGFLQEMIDGSASAAEQVQQNLASAIGGGDSDSVADAFDSVGGAASGLMDTLSGIANIVTAIASVAALFKKSGPSSTDSWHFEQIWINTKEIRDYMFLVQRNWLTKEIPERISKGNAKLDGVKGILRDIRSNTADTVSAINAIPSGQHGLDFASGPSGGLIRYHPNERVTVAPNISVQPSPVNVNMQSTPVNIYLDSKLLAQGIAKHVPGLSRDGHWKMHPRGLVSQ